MKLSGTDLQVITQTQRGKLFLETFSDTSCCSVFVVILVEFENPVRSKSKYQLMVRKAGTSWSGGVAQLALGHRTNHNLNFWTPNPSDFLAELNNSKTKDVGHRANHN